MIEQITVARSRLCKLLPPSDTPRLNGEIFALEAATIKSDTVLRLSALCLVAVLRTRSTSDMLARWGILALPLSLLLSMQGVADPEFTDDSMVVLFVKIASGVGDENIVTLIRNVLILSRQWLHLEWITVADHAVLIR
jgi:hypothetical protein